MSPNLRNRSVPQGEAGYSMRLMDIRTLKLKCGDLMRDLAIARGSSNQMDELRREVFQLQRDLLQVCTALLCSRGLPTKRACRSTPLVLGRLVVPLS